ncbi:hypothetical protein GF373_12430 [bacterium]|nr:hypothetical protein [bacterium]
MMQNKIESAENEQKNEAVKAALLSALVMPGVGQIYNREWGKGLFLAFTFLLASLGVLIPITIALVNYYMATAQGNIEGAEASVQPVLDAWIHLIVLTGLSGILYVYSIIDSYQKRKNKLRLEK